MCEFKKFNVTQAKTFIEHQKRIWNELKREQNYQSDTLLVLEN